MKNKFKLLPKILLLFVLVVLNSCEMPSSSQTNDGLIYITLTDLDQLTGYVKDSSTIACGAYAENGGNYTLIDNTGCEITGSDGSNVVFAVGYPEYTFTGGGVYYIDVLVDIDGLGSYSDAGVDYWLKYFVEVTVDGDMNISINKTLFELRS